TSKKRPHQFPHACGGIVVCSRRCGRKTSSPDPASEPKWRSAVPCGKNAARARDDAAAAERRRLENGACASAGGIRPRRGRVSVRLCTFGAARGFLGGGLSW